MEHLIIKNSLGEGKTIRRADVRHDPEVIEDTVFALMRASNVEHVELIDSNFGRNVLSIAVFTRNTPITAVSAFCSALTITND